MLLSNIGQPQWTWHDETVADGRWAALLPRPGGVWLAVGGATPQAGDRELVAVASIDSRGRVQWRRSCGNPSPQRALGVVELASWQLALAGLRTVKGKDHHVELRLDAAGKRLWQRVSPSSDFRGRAVAVRQGAYTALEGEAVTASSGDTDAWLMGLGPLGNGQWQGSQDGGGQGSAGRAVPAGPGAGNRPRLPDQPGKYRSSKSIPWLLRSATKSSRKPAVA